MIVSLRWNNGFWQQPGPWWIIAAAKKNPEPTITCCVFAEIKQSFIMCSAARFILSARRQQRQTGCNKVGRGNKHSRCSCSDAFVDSLFSVSRTWTTSPPCSAKTSTWAWWRRTQRKERSSQLCWPRTKTLRWVLQTYICGSIDPNIKGPILYEIHFTYFL